MKTQVATRGKWLAARKELLAAERAYTHAYDALAEKRRALPWVPVEKDYVFDSPDGARRLDDLFEGRSQLFVYHFMLSPGGEGPCPGCSFICDHVDAARRHFEQADLSFAAVSRATIAEIEKVKNRLGWNFTWVSSNGSDFNYDFDVSFTPGQIAAGEATYNFAPYDGDEEDLHGCSVFAKDEKGKVYHTYSCYARGAEKLLGAFMFLDLTPHGRNETGGTMSWVRLHDEYGASGQSSCCGCGE